MKLFLLYFAVVRTPVNIAAKIEIKYKERNVPPRALKGGKNEIPPPSNPISRNEISNTIDLKPIK